MLNYLKAYVFCPFSSFLIPRYLENVGISQLIRAL